LLKKSPSRWRKTDLHLHSNKSDGEYPPRELVRLVHEAGVGVMALTDHDSAGGLAEADAAAAEYGDMVFIPGIETTTLHAHEQHILGYYIDYEGENLRAFSERLIAMRRTRAENILEYLRGRDVILGKEREDALMNAAYIGRPQIAAAIVDAGYAEDPSDAFARYLSGPEFRKLPRPKPTAEESIASIRACGGAAVLAHPASLRLGDAELEKHAGDLKSMGLAGMECHYGEYDAAQTQRYIAIADSLGLIVTGGSDFHGPHVKAGMEIGTGRDGRLNFHDAEVAERLRAAAQR
jgi:predicted metal-dependent phosphoesterase TrpH